MNRPTPDPDHADSSAPRRESEPDEAIRATACTTAPGRTLLVEEGNCDGWLSSDLVVDVSEHR